MSACFYRDSSPYDDAHYDTQMYESRIDVDEETSERASVGRYGIRHKVEGLDFEAFKEAIGADGRELANAVRCGFSGEDGVCKFGGFCEATGCA